MFKLPAAEAPRPLALLQLIAIPTLAISSLVAATAVSIGSRAQRRIASPPRPPRPRQSNRVTSPEARLRPPCTANATGLPH